MDDFSVEVEVKIFMAYGAGVFDKRTKVRAEFGAKCRLF